MQRRDWLKGVSVTGMGLLYSRWVTTAEAATSVSEKFPALADLALSHALSLGASFADFHVMQTDTESLFAREEMVQGVNANSRLGCSVRVIVNGAWGFAAGESLSEAAIKKMTEAAVALAKGQAGWRANPVEIESLPAYEGTWEMPMKIDPFTIPLEEKVEHLLGINRSALGAGANFCSSYIRAVRERKWLPDRFGSCLSPSRGRGHSRLPGPGAGGGGTNHNGGRLKHPGCPRPRLCAGLCRRAG